MKKAFAIILLLVGNLSGYSQEKRVFFPADTARSVIHWKCDIHNGTFRIKYGGFLSVNDSLRLGAFVIDIHSFADADIDRKSFETAYVIFQNTIKDEFLEADAYPYAYFITESIQPEGEGKYLISGDFTLHGITRNISFVAHISYRKNRFTLQSDTFVIDRTEWGILRLSAKNPVPDDENGWTVPDKVSLRLHLEFVTNKS